MKIEKYKYLGNGRYKVYIGDEEYIIYEDIILKYNILSKEEIAKIDLDKYLENNSFYDAYYKSVKYINIKLRCKKEIESYLLKSNYENKIVNEVIDKLIKDGYLNEKFYIESYINDQINLKNVGPLKIKKDLINLGFRDELINKYLNVFDKDIEKEKIDKIINKEVKLNKNKSEFILKQKIFNLLREKGFSLELINEKINKIEFDDKDIYDKEYNKLYEKLSKKYSGKELEYKLKQKMYQKGFRDNI